MAPPVGEQTWRTADPHRIDLDLALLWRDLARDAPLVRAVLSNLIVFEGAAAGPASGPRATLDEVAQRHPSRVIVLEHQRAQNDAGAPLSASIGVLIFGGTGARYGVERVLIRSACSETALPSIVRGLLLGDMPTTVWWTVDLSQASLLAPLAAMGRQLVFDSRCWSDVERGVRALAPFVDEAGSLDLADLNWRRLEPVRRALIHHLQAASPDLRTVQVRVGHAAGERTLAWLLTGWLEARLSPDAHLDIAVTEFEREDAILKLSLGPERHVTTATLTARDVVVRDESGGAALSIPVPRESEAAGVAAELQSLARSGGLHDTLAVLARRFGSA